MRRGVVLVELLVQGPVLLGAGLSTTVRAARGVDVSGACGQLETAVKRQRLLKAATYARW